MDITGLGGCWARLLAVVNQGMATDLGLCKAEIWGPVGCRRARSSRGPPLAWFSLIVWRASSLAPSCGPAG